MSQSRTYSTFVCPCGFEARRTGQETIKKLDIIVRLHKKYCKAGGEEVQHNIQKLKENKKDMWRENECRETHSKWCEAFKTIEFAED
jgi:hypothetical protein